MATTGSKIRVRVYKVIGKNKYKLKLFMGTKSMELIVTPTSVFYDANVIAVWPTSKHLYESLYFRNLHALRVILPTLIQTALLLA